MVAHRKSLRLGTIPLRQFRERDCERFAFRRYGLLLFVNVGDPFLPPSGEFTANTAAFLRGPLDVTEVDGNSGNFAPTSTFRFSRIPVGILRGLRGKTFWNPAALGAPAAGCVEGIWRPGLSCTAGWERSNVVGVETSHSRVACLQKNVFQGPGVVKTGLARSSVL